MAKVALFSGDQLHFTMEIPKDRFLFIIAEDGRVYHIDFADGNMWTARPGFENLGGKHGETLKELIKK